MFLRRHVKECPDTVNVLQNYQNQNDIMKKKISITFTLYLGKNILYKILTCLIQVLYIATFNATML